MGSPEEDTIINSTHVEKITNTFPKRRIVFYGHVVRMSSIRLSSRMISYFLNKKNNKEAWFTEVEKDMLELSR